jgi:site-specific recombinase XerD
MKVILAKEIIRGAGSPLIHLLPANDDIRTIQELPGHTDVRTMMVYTHCVPSRTVKEAKSPLGV